MFKYLHWDDFPWALANFVDAAYHLIDTASGHFICGTYLGYKVNAMLCDWETREQEKCDIRMDRRNKRDEADQSPER